MFEEDEQGRLTLRDAQGRNLQRIGEAETEIFERDAQGRVRAVTWRGAPHRVLRYDAAGNVLGEARRRHRDAGPG